MAEVKITILPPVTVEVPLKFQKMRATRYQFPKTDAEYTLVFRGAYHTQLAQFFQPSRIGLLCTRVTPGAEFRVSSV